MKKRLTVILCAVALMLAACVAAAGVGRIEYVAADLAKRTATVAWTWTDLADNAVRLSLTRNGEDFPTAGWGGTLFMGDGALGCAVAGTPSGYNDLLFDVGRDNVPTNGKYVVQIIATNTAGRVEEWARGTLTVRANPAAEGMPTNWSAYADIARKVAPFIDAQGILSDPANAAALWGAVSNRTDALIQAVAPSSKPPANYAAVSNAAMNAVQSQSGTARDLSVYTLTTHPVAGIVWGWDGIPYGRLYSPQPDDLRWGQFGHERQFAFQPDLAAIASSATNYTDSATNALAAYATRSYVDDNFLSGTAKGYEFATFHPIKILDGWLCLDNSSTGGGPTILGYDSIYLYDGSGISWRDVATAANGFDALSARVTAATNALAASALAATNYTDSAISTNNPAFVAAVVATPTGAPDGDVAEIAEYGSYGTVGAAILALIAGLAALKRGKFDVAGDARSVTAEDSGGTESYAFIGSGEVGNANAVARIKNLPYADLGEAAEMLVGVYSIETRGVTRHTVASGETTATFGFTEPPTGGTLDALLDIDNSGNSSDFALEFYGLGTDFELVCDADSDLAELTVVEKQTRARFLITQTAFITSGGLPVLSLQRLPLGAFAATITRS